MRIALPYRPGQETGIFSRVSGHDNGIVCANEGIK